MKLRILASFLVGVLVTTLVIFFIQSPALTRAFDPQTKPTVANINARYLQSKRAKDFMPTSAADQFIPSSQSVGIAKAAVSGICQCCDGASAPLIDRSFNTVNGVAPTITFLEGHSGFACNIDLGFDVTNAYVVLSSGDGKTTRFGQDGTIIGIERTTAGAFYLIVY